MSRRVEWSDDDRAAAYVNWVANEKNVRKTARECGIGHTTLAYWAKDWEKNGPPPKIDDKIANTAYEFIHHANSDAAPPRHADAQQQAQRVPILL